MPNACREACQAAFRNSVQRCFDVLTQGLQTATTPDEVNQRTIAFQKCMSICEQARAICLETCGEAEEETQNPPIAENLLQVQKMAIADPCGSGSHLHTIFNRSGADQRYTITIRNSGDHCNINILSTPLPHNHTNPIDMVASVLPGETGSTAIAVPSGSDIQLHWECRGSDPSHQCTGEVTVYQHT